MAERVTRAIGAAVLKPKVSAGNASCRTASHHSVRLARQQRVDQHESGDARRQGDADRQAADRARQQRRFDEENADQHQPDPELRQRHAAQGGAAHQEIRPALAIDRRDHAERDADGDAERKPDQAELERGRQPVQTDPTPRSGRW